MICFQKTPARAWGEWNKNWDFWWIGIAFRQTFIGIVIRTKRQPKESE